MKHIHARIFVKEISRFICSCSGRAFFLSSLFLILLGCAPTPNLTNAPTIASQTATPTSLPTSTPEPIISSWFVVKEQVPTTFSISSIISLKPLKGAELLVFPDFTEPSNHIRYGYTSWDGTQQGILLDGQFTDATATPKGYNGLWIRIDPDLNLWVPAAIDVYHFQLLKINLFTQHVAQYSFSSECVITLGGNLPQEDLGQKVAFDYLDFLLTECPKEEQNGLAIVSLKNLRVVTFIPKSSFSEPYEDERIDLWQWIFPDTLMVRKLVMVNYSSTNYCLIRVPSLRDSCQEPPFEVGEISLDRKWVRVSFTTP